MSGLLRRVGVFLAGAGAAFVLSCTGFAAGGIAAGSIARTPTPSRPIEGFGLFWEAWTIVERDFVGDVPPEEEVHRGAARGLLRALGDPATGLIAPEFARLDREDSSGYYRGIGASVRYGAHGYVEIAVVFAGSPADEAGLRPGDVILSVDGEDMAGVGLYEVVSRIRGPEGTHVEIEFRRPGVESTFTRLLERREIEIPTVTLEVLEGGIGHLALSDFNGRATAQLRDQLRQARRAGVTALILDLRGNPGGYLDQAVSVADEFLDRGTVVVERGREVPEKAYGSHEGGLATDMELVVLVNEGSASASEIVAGAVQALGRGTVIGTRTFGKGSVQYAFDLSDGSQIRVTTALWYTPDDRLIQGEGLEPDITVADDPETEVDEPLEAAVLYLKERAD
ncbi:MAG: S41 family peptidase [Anaerolineae bacterium]|nr:S41 family peptidase [Anaerolineae bacterium]